MLWVLGAAGFACVALVIAQASRYRHERTVKQWDRLLSPGMRFAVQSLELEVQTDAAIADSGLHAAQRARDRQDLAEAIRLLELSCAAVERATPERLKRLRAMAVLIRMAAALVPVRPLRIRDYHLRELVALVGVGAALHHVLVSALERFLLRLQVLGIGFRLALRVLLGARRQAAASPAAPRPWGDFERALADWKALDREHLETFKALARSLESEG
ncbi:MAG: hypothetical protein DMF80_00470 [Acidobacteria bacterium]|nr:MAG: hypothetical protein DMF80_00470 [Acidobacteriota bacterium]PYQ18059.1 MAG: hypothetical protein DMF81_26060 [Acidobacteriota bacterium]